MRIFLVVVGLSVLSGSFARADDVPGLVRELETFKPGRQDQRADVRALVKIGKPAVAPLIAALKNPKVAALAATALGLIKDKEAAAPLAQCAIKVEAAASACGAALIAIDDPDAVPVLRAFVKKPKGKPLYLYDGALPALGHFKDKESVASIKKLAKHKSQYVRGSVAIALGQIGDAGAAKEVLALIKDKDQIVAGFALIAAGRLKLEEAKPAMLEAFKGKDARAGGEALGHFGAHEPLYEALKSKQFQQREGAVLGLAASGEDKAFAAVSALLDEEQINGGVAQAAGDGFVIAGQKRGVAPLRKVRKQFEKKKGYSSVVELIDAAIAKLESK